MSSDDHFTSKTVKGFICVEHCLQKRPRPVFFLVVLTAAMSVVACGCVVTPERPIWFADSSGVVVGN